MTPDPVLVGEATGWDVKAGLRDVTVKLTTDGVIT